MSKFSGNILITGASTGIGEACTLHMAKLGYRVFAGVRKEKDAERLQQQDSQKIVPVYLDVLNEKQIKQAVSQIAESVGDNGLQGLVNNAGIAVVGPLEYLPLEDIRRQIEINVYGQIAVTQSVLELLRQGQGRIVNMSSLSGRFAFPLYGAYAASKFALEAITDALRRELAPWKMHVASIEPGVIRTPIWEKSLKTNETTLDQLPAEAYERYGERIEAARKGAARSGKGGLPPEEVAKVVAHALTARRPKTRYVLGRNAKPLVFLTRILPDWLLDRITAASS
ncbi:MAG: SDR family NAD(P)-dependent oxidoreductase [Chloroflexi bacterium]|nr:MAG: SDR family NAD(P)-dependent oxidoreductase [Chloroflexota bacterium]MBL1192817.1 SDR family oxidoreductase [Chloroflexota bacterium]NOH10110.1 SDR family oxidoreductase [Chloroflexota bacterium]